MIGSLKPLVPAKKAPAKRAQLAEAAKTAQRTLRTRGAQKLYGK